MIKKASSKSHITKTKSNNRNKNGKSHKNRKGHKKNNRKGGGSYNNNNSVSVNSDWVNNIKEQLKFKIKSEMANQFKNNTGPPVLTQVELNEDDPTIKFAAYLFSNELKSERIATRIDSIKDNIKIEILKQFLSRSKTINANKTHNSTKERKKPLSAENHQKRLDEMSAKFKADSERQYAEFEAEEQKRRKEHENRMKINHNEIRKMEEETKQTTREINKYMNKNIDDLINICVQIEEWLDQIMEIDENNTRWFSNSIAGHMINIAKLLKFNGDESGREVMYQLFHVKQFENINALSVLTDGEDKKQLLEEFNIFRVRLQTFYTGLYPETESIKYKEVKTDNNLTHVMAEKKKVRESLQAYKNLHTPISKTNMDNVKQQLHKIKGMLENMKSTSA